MNDVDDISVNKSVAIDDALKQHIKDTISLDGLPIQIIDYNENIENIEYVSLLDHEKKVVEILKEAENRTLWQKQIQIKSGFSKVKLSRLIKALEARGVVKKEPWGNTNKIILLNHRSLGENEENVSEEKGAENGGEKDEEKSEEKKPSLEKKEINEEEETQDP